MQQKAQMLFSGDYSLKLQTQMVFFETIPGIASNGQIIGEGNFTGGSPMAEKTRLFESLYKIQNSFTRYWLYNGDF